LLTVLFEDASEGLKWYDKISKHLCESDERPWDMLSLFNSTDESDASEKFGVGQDYFNELAPWKQDQVKLLRSWCLFADREWFRNVLVIVGEVSERIYGSKTDIPDYFLKKCGLDDEKVHAHMKRWKSSNISGHGFSYSAIVANKKITVQPENMRPKQFKLDKLPSMTTITATVGKGWDRPEALNYFSADNDGTIDPKENLMTTLHSFEEANILYSTMKRIKVTTNEKNEKIFSIECFMADYDEKNEAIRKRHSKLFKDDKYSFCPSDDLVKSIPFEFIRGLKNDKYLQLPSKWLKNVKEILKKAEVNSIVKMKLFRLLRSNEYIKQPSNSLDHIIYEVQLENGSSRLVSFGEISNLVGDEKSTQGETNCLSDIGSGRWLNFGWGAKKKDSSLLEDISTSDFFSVGEEVIVENHGNHWDYRGKIVSIDSDNDTAMIRWESTRKTEEVDVKDLKKYSVSEKSLRKRKPTDFFLPQINPKFSDENMDTEDEIQNKFYSRNNSAKLCAEGSLVNLLDQLGCSHEDMEVFWDIVRDQSLQSVCAKLGEKSVPKKVYKKGEGVDSIEKSIWILHKLFHFDFTTRMKESSFQNLQHTMNFLSKVIFPVIIAVKGTFACYHHVIVVWKNVVYDYESKHRYPLTNESLTQVCGQNTTFHGISCGYGIFPPKKIKQLAQNAHICDWGLTEWKNKNSPVRKYFI
jgi:hypothetical protein